MRHRTRSEAGIALVEFVVLLPLFIILVFGTIEFGAAWSTKLKVETAARAGARVGSGLGTTRLADWTLLQNVKSVLEKIGLSNVDYVVVYKATASDGSIPSGCSGSSPTSQTGSCNVYTGAQLSSLTQASFTGTTSCGTTAPDRFWCPTTRQKVMSQSPDYLGVWIKANSPTVTKIFASPLPLQSRAVMRLEPA